MREIYDQCAKDVLSGVLERGATVTREAEIMPERQAVDLVFEQDPARAAALEPFGLIARIAETGPGLIECFHDPPSTDDVVFCLQKQIEHRRRRANERPPPLWILSAGVPHTVIRELGFRARSGWPSGVQTAAAGLHVHLVVIPELPVVRGTLILRLLGAGAVLRAAITELARLPADAPERRAALPAVLRLSHELHLDSFRNPEDEATMQTTDEWYREFREALLAEGQREGRAEGTKNAVRRLLRARFGELDAAVEARIDSASLEDIERCIDRVLLAKSIDDVFG